MHLLFVGLSELEMHLYIISVMDVLCCESAVVGQHCAGHKGQALETASVVQGTKDSCDVNPAVTLKLHGEHLPTKQLGRVVRAQCCYSIINAAVIFSVLQIL